MEYLNILQNNKKLILQDWFSSVADSYPSDTSNFLKTKKDPFSNPVGKTTYNSLKGLFEGIVSGIDNNHLVSYLDPIIRIRAVQDFKPSDAVKFVFVLKDIVYRHSNFDNLDLFPNDLLIFNKRIDALALMAFDIYMMCREKIYELKANEARNQFFSSLSRAGLIVET